VDNWKRLWKTDYRLENDIRTKYSIVEPGLEAGFRKRISSIVSQRTKWGYQVRINIRLKCAVLEEMKIYRKPAAVYGGKSYVWYPESGP
jgi:hypothetical protein